MITNRYGVRIPLPTTDRMRAALLAALDSDSMEFRLAVDGNPFIGEIRAQHDPFKPLDLDPALGEAVTFSRKGRTECIRGQIIRELPNGMVLVKNLDRCVAGSRLYAGPIAFTVHPSRIKRNGNCSKLSD